MDLVHATPNFQMEIAPVNMKFTGGQGVKNTDSYFFINIPWLQICVRRVNFVYKINWLIFMHDRVQKRGGVFLIELQFESVGMKILGVEMH